MTKWHHIHLFYSLSNKFILKYFFHIFFNLFSILPPKFIKKVSLKWSLHIHFKLLYLWLSSVMEHWSSLLKLIWVILFLKLDLFPFFLLVIVCTLIITRRAFRSFNLSLLLSRTQFIRIILSWASYLVQCRLSQNKIIIWTSILHLHYSFFFN